MGGFSIGYGIGIGPRTAAFDADALAYFATAGITDPTAQIQINDFVKGIKDLGLWSSMVSWPLRSSQNKGSGTTAYSLGGLGTYNGTLAGTSLPTWGSEGIDFTSASANYISTTYAPTFTPTTAIIVGNSDDVVTTRSYFGQVKSDWLGMRLRRQNDTLRPQLGGTFVNSASFALELQPNHFLGIGFDSTTSISVLLNSNEISLTLPATPSIGVGTIPSYIIGKAGDFAEYWDGVISFFMVINQRLSFSQINQLRSTYKTTLGQGLGLP